MHESVAKARPFNHEQPRVNELVPQYVIPSELRNRANGLIKFLEKYYEYLNQPGNPSYQLDHIVSENDIDKTSEEFLGVIQKEIAILVPESEVVDRVTLYKRIVHFYRNKGTPSAVKAFFQIFFGNKEYELIVDQNTPYTYKIGTDQPILNWYYKFKNLVHPVGLKFIAIYKILIEGSFLQTNDSDEAEKIRLAIINLVKPINAEAPFWVTNSANGMGWRSGIAYKNPTLLLHYPLTEDHVIDTTNESEGAKFPTSWYEPDDNSDDQGGSDISDWNTRAITYLWGRQVAVDEFLSPSSTKKIMIVNDLSGYERHAVYRLQNTNLISNLNGPKSDGFYWTGSSLPEEMSDAPYGQLSPHFMMPVPHGDYGIAGDLDRIETHNFGQPWSLDNAADWSITFWLKTDELQPDDPIYYDGKYRTENNMYWFDNSEDPSDAWLADVRPIVAADTYLSGQNIITNKAQICLSDGGLISYIYSKEGDNVLVSRDIQSKTRVNDNKWHHIAFVNSGADQQLKIYVDGHLETIGFNDLLNPDSSDAIGPYYFFFNSLMRGQVWQDYDEGELQSGLQEYPANTRGYLRDFRVYGSAISITEVRTLARRVNDQFAIEILKLLDNSFITNDRNHSHLSEYQGFGKFFDSTRIGNYADVTIENASTPWNELHPMRQHNAGSYISLKYLDSDSSSSAFNSDDWGFTDLDELSDSESEPWF